MCYLCPQSIHPQWGEGDTRPDAAACGDTTITPAQHGEENTTQRGAAFCAECEAACQQLGTRVFVLPPKSPKLDGAVERARRTHTEEFSEVHECAWTVRALNPEFLQWGRIHKTIRPHQALGYLTPLRVLQQPDILPNKDLSVSRLY